MALIPVVIWNMDLGWVSFVFQSARGMVTDGYLLHPGNVAITLLGQVGYLWPPVWLAPTTFMWRGGRGGSSTPHHFFWGVLAGSVLFFFPVSFFFAPFPPPLSSSGFLLCLSLFFPRGRP